MVTWSSVNLNLLADVQVNFISFSAIKIPFSKRSFLKLFIDVRVVPARLLILVWQTATFLLDLQCTQVFYLLVENALKVLNNQQYLIMYLNVTVQQILIIWYSSLCCKQVKRDEPHLKNHLIVSIKAIWFRNF